MLCVYRGEAECVISGPLRQELNRLRTATVVREMDRIKQNCCKGVGCAALSDRCVLCGFKFSFTLRLVTGRRRKKKGCGALSDSELFAVLNNRFITNRNRSFGC